MTLPALQTFDYTAIPSEEAEVYQREAVLIHQCDALEERIWAEKGAALERAFHANKGNFERWLKAEFGRSRDWAETYINIYRRLPQANYDRFDVGAAQLLARKSTPEESREWAVKQAETLPAGERVDLELSRISLVASVRKRYESGELSKPQASNLALALRSIEPEILDLCIKERVSWAEVALYLNSAFKERARRSTWNDLQTDALHFCWSDDAGATYTVPMEQMTPDALAHGYIAYRRWMHYEERKQEAAVKNAEQWAEGMLRPLKVERLGGGRVAIVVSASQIPADARELELRFRYRKET